jgi:hypothetical protein
MRGAPFTLPIIAMDFIVAKDFYRIISVKILRDHRGSRPVRRRTAAAGSGTAPTTSPRVIADVAEALDRAAAVEGGQSAQRDRADGRLSDQRREHHK